MKRRIVSIALVVLMLASVFAFASCSSDTASGETIKLGVVGPMTGDYSLYGTSVRDGALLAAEEINAAGGINGQEVEIVYADSKGDPVEGVNAYNKLRDEDGIVGLIGGTFSGVTLAIKEIAITDNMPVLTPTATNVDVTVDAPSVYRACYLDDYQGATVASFAEETLGAETAAIIYNKDDAYSEGLYEGFEAAFGGEIVAIEAYGAQDKDYSAQLTSIQAENPDVLFIPDYVATVGPILEKVSDMGMEVTCLGGDGWDGIQADYADAAEGTYFANHYAADNPSEVVQNFITGFADAYDGETPTALAALAYDATFIMADAIEAAGSTDSQAVIDALAETDYTGTTGAIKFDEQGDPDQKTVSIIKVTDGGLVFEEEVTAE
jgi:branched-chain amino acid transport system substrate-binding protein